MVDHVARHQAARLLGEERDDLRLVTLDLQKARRDHVRLQCLGQGGAGIFLRRQVDDRVAALGLRFFRQALCQGVAPELIERGRFARLQLRAHFQPVGSNQVHRPQHAVQPRQDAQMILRPI